jgi:hypothetical protein
MIGILTLHYGYNEGAILQAYAMACVLRNRGGKDALIVDHRYPAKIAIYSREWDARKEKLEWAINNWLPLTNRHFFSNYETETWRYIQSSCETIVVGSDQVWRLRYQKKLAGLWTAQPDRFVGRFPNIYWPPPWLRVAKHAYAASVGDVDMGPVPRRHRRTMAKILDDFGTIGVRDERTAEFVRTLSRSLDDRIVICPDPTLLVPWETRDAAESLTMKLEQFGVSKVERLCLIGVTAGQFANELAAELRRLGFRLIGYSSDDNYSDIRLATIGLSPLEWVALFGKVNLCITDRMHAFIFSVLSQCPCIVIDWAAKSSLTLTRIGDFANKVGCQQFVVRPPISVAEVTSRIKEMQPDWYSIANRVFAMREVGLKVIDRIVGNEVHLA